MLKHKIYWAVLISLIVLTGFIGLEATARFFEEKDRYVVTKEFDAVLGWHLLPGNHFVRAAGRFKATPLDVNAYGLRDEAFPVKAPDDEKRILVLGDSFVFSRHFPIKETFTGRLQSILSEDRGKKVHVINAGVPGYGTGQELLFMKKLAEEAGLVPDEYLLVMFPNDILDNLSLSYGSYEPVPVKPRFELDASGKAVLKQLPVNSLDDLQETFRHPELDNPWKPRSVQFIRANIVSFFQSHPRLIKMVLSLGVKLELPRKPGLLNGWYDSRVVNDGLPLMKALLEQMKETAEKYGVPFRVVIVPSPVQIYPELYQRILSSQFPDDPEVKGWIADPLKAQRVMGEMCKELHLDYLDLYPVFESQRLRNLYLPRDGHFDAAAHEIVAQSIAAWLEQDGTVSRNNSLLTPSFLPQVNNPPPAQGNAK